RCALKHLQRARHGRPKGARQNGNAGPPRERATARGVRFPRLHGTGAWRVSVKESASCRSGRWDTEIPSCPGLRGRIGWQEAGSQETIREQQLAPRQATAFVSIMQGCNMHCTFCIVPQTRGGERSRSIVEIVGEVHGLVSRGVKEVTLLGQIVNLYGRHEFPKRGSKSPFVQLLEAVHEIDGLERLRFTSPHPIGFRDDLIDAIARLSKLAEHVHLPLQSGSNRILKA